MGSAIYRSEGFWCTVDDHPDGGWYILAVKLEDRNNPRRQYAYHVTDDDWDEVVKRVAALPFCCDPESNWEPYWGE
jgi:hypothetical protein